ncbi:hypothetical protein MMC30_000940 [Trapelia coarctata]|nr:hypothetical protein [Trapelia coarctata]
MAAILIGKLTPEQLGAFSNVPALSPPPGVQSNFVNPENQNQIFYIVTSILFGIMVVFFLNRLYAKLVKIRKYSWDDLTLILAFVGIHDIMPAYYVASIWSVQKGRIGTHQWDINVPQILSLNLLISTYLLSIMTEVALLFAKVTFFLMYLDIFKPMRWMRISSAIGTITTAAFYVGIIISNLVISTPSHGESWAEVSIKAGSLVLSVPQAAVGLAIDLYILFLPMIAISKLQLNPRRKVGVNLIFMSGALACIASVLKIYYSSNLNHTADITWATLPVNIVTLTELAVGISCACMPSAAYTCRHHLPSYSAFKSSFFSRLRSLKSSSSRPSPTSSGTNLTAEKLQGHHEPYARLGSPRYPGMPGLSQGRTVLTFIRGGKREDVEKYERSGSADGSGIHLSYEVCSDVQHSGQGW